MISLAHIMHKLNELADKVARLPRFEWGTVLRSDPVTIITDKDPTPITGVSVIGRVSSGDRVRIERQGNKAVVWAVGANALRSSTDLAPDWTANWLHGTFPQKHPDKFVFKGVVPSVSNNNRIFTQGLSLVDGRSYRLSFRVTNNGTSPLYPTVGFYYVTSGGTWVKSEWAPSGSNSAIGAGVSTYVSHTITVDYTSAVNASKIVAALLGHYAQGITVDYSVDGVTLTDVTDALAVSGETTVYRGTGAARLSTVAKKGDIWHDTDGSQVVWKGASNGKWRMRSVTVQRPSTGWELSQHPVHVRTDSFSNISNFWLEDSEYLIMEVSGAGNGFEFSSLVSYTSNETSRTSNVIIRKCQLFATTAQPSSYTLRIMDK